MSTPASRVPHPTAAQAKALGQERQFYMPRVTQAVRIPHKPERVAKVCACARASSLGGRAQLVLLPCQA